MTSAICTRSIRSIRSTGCSGFSRTDVHLRRPAPSPDDRDAGRTLVHTFMAFVNPEVGRSAAPDVAAGGSVGGVPGAVITVGVVGLILIGFWIYKCNEPIAIDRVTSAPPQSINDCRDACNRYKADCRGISCGNLDPARPGECVAIEWRLLKGIRCVVGQAWVIINCDIRGVPGWVPNPDGHPCAAASEHYAIAPQRHENAA